MEQTPHSPAHHVRVVELVDERTPSRGPGWSTKDRGWMGEALGLARSMQGLVWPNPSVGCVIVRDGAIVGRGRTQIGGRPHAERMALDEAGETARGATLYVTLEPCCHWGRTPPCADAIIAAGVRKVFASIQDPDPRVNGGGFRKLQEAGIEVDVGLAANEARTIMAGFFHRVETGRPLVTVGNAPDDLSWIPAGYDAVVRSGPDRLWVLTRAQGVGVLARQTDHTGAATQQLLQALGRLGLTTIFIPDGDPLLVNPGTA